MDLWRKFLPLVILLLSMDLRAGNTRVFHDADGTPVLFSDSSPWPLFGQSELQRRFNPLVEKIAAEVFIDSDLVSAVITQESGWHPMARSPKGAMGLMQLMPETALNWNVKNPYDPRENVLAGSRHLQYLLTLFEGNIPLALAAYHAGEERTLKTGKIPSIKETQNYVKAVMALYNRPKQK